MIINNVKYLTLSEYCEAVNAERSKTGLNPISEVDGSLWYSWPEKTVR